MSKDLANHLFTYCNGELHWRDNSHHPRRSIKVGYQHSKGYKALHCEGRSYYVHNVIWNMHYGTIQHPYTIDHIDRNKSNNLISNLRLSIASDQQLNRGMQSNNKSGHIGVHWQKAAERWVAQVQYRRKTKHLGSFKTIEEAINARAEYKQSRGLI
jgi:hypothetical protein